MTKNIVAFVLLSFVVIFGWQFLQQRIWPPRPVDPNKLAQVKDNGKKKDEPKKDETKKDDKDVPPKTDGKAPDDKKSPEEKKDDKPAAPVVEEKPIPAPDKVRTYELGNDTSYLKVLLTNRGAGVQRLTLTKFQAADYLGRPEARQLEFIQDDPYVPSFVMGVYADPAEGKQLQAELAERLWNAVSEEPQKDGDGWKMSFWTLIRIQDKEKKDAKVVELKVVKTYRLVPVDYHVRLSLEIQNTDPAEKAKIRYQLTGGHGLPVEGEWYTPPTNIRTSVIGKLDDRDNLYRKQEDAARIVDKKDADGNPNKQGTKEFGDTKGPIQYAGVMTQYFASVILPDPKQTAGDWRSAPNILGSASPSVESDEMKVTLNKIEDDSVVFTHSVTKNKIVQNIQIQAKLLPRAAEHVKVLKLKVGDACVLNLARNAANNGDPIVQWFRLGTTPLTYLDDLTVRVASDEITLNAGEKVTHGFWLYHGPVKTRLLGQMAADAKVPQKLVDEYTYTLHLNTLTDYHSDNPIAREVFSRIGWTWLLISTTNLMHTLLYYLHFVSFGSWGLSIILLTIVVRGAMFPISRKQALMAQKMQALAPEIKKLQERYKDDKPSQAQATMELYRKHKVSPAGGCMPLLLQMPIFMGLYYCLQESVQFRLARFLWIENLAAPDMLVWWGQGIPWISDPNSMGGMLYLGPYFNLLPVIAVAFMVVQQKLMTPPPQNEEQEIQQKTMRIMMAVMGIFFYKVAAGLCLYFISSSVWGVLERKLLPKKDAPGALTPSPGAPSTNGGPKYTNARDRRREKEKEKAPPETTLGRLKEWWRKLLESAEKK